MSVFSPHLITAFYFLFGMWLLPRLQRDDDETTYLRDAGWPQLPWRAPGAYWWLRLFPGIRSARFGSLCVGGVVVYLTAMISPFAGLILATQGTIVGAFVTGSYHSVIALGWVVCLYALLGEHWIWLSLLPWVFTIFRVTMLPSAIGFTALACWYLPIALTWVIPVALLIGGMILHQAKEGRRVFTLATAEVTPYSWAQTGWIFIRRYESLGWWGVWAVWQHETVPWTLYGILGVTLLGHYFALRQNPKWMVGYLPDWSPLCAIILAHMIGAPAWTWVDETLFLLALAWSVIMPRPPHLAGPDGSAYNVTYRKPSFITNSSLNKET